MKNKQQTYQDLEKRQEEYYIPDMDTGEPIKVNKQAFDAYNFFMKYMEKLDKAKTKKEKDENRD